MRTVSYPSDLTGFQWSLIKPHLPVYPGGRPRKTDLRDVVDAIFYILRTGCQWRYLPKDFPPKSTVWRYFNQWRHNGTLETIHDLLRRKVRAAEKPYSPRTSASVDSQSVDTTSGGEQRGRDNAKNVDGRKRHIVVDSMGLLMAVLVTAASIDDAKAAAELFARLDGQPMSHVKRMYADSKYHNFILYEWVETNAAWELNIVQRPKDAVGWVLLPIRWTVERTFAWLGRCRRLSKDREKSVRSSEAFVKLAMIHLMLNRLAQKKRMPSSTIVRRHKPTCGTDTKKLCCKKGVADEKYQQILIRFLHDLGDVLYFHDPQGPYHELRDTNILNPEWVTKGVYKILNNLELIHRHGVLDRERLGAILSDSRCYPPSRHDFIIGMMRKFELCFEFPDCNGQRLLIPELLHPNEPELGFDTKKALNLEYHYNVLPSGLISRFIVRMHHRLSPKPTYWRSGVVLEIDGNLSLVRADTQRGRIFVSVLGPKPSRPRALAAIRDAFAYIHSTIPKIGPEEKVPLNADHGFHRLFKYLMFA